MSDARPLQHGDRVCFVYDQGTPDLEDLGNIVQLHDRLTVYWDADQPWPTEHDTVEPDGWAVFDDENGTSFTYRVQALPDQWTRVEPFSNDELEARMTDFEQAHEEYGTKDVTCTCAGCPRERICNLSWDTYNTQGECVWRK